MAHLIERDPRGDQDRRYDLVIVGGGVYGCMLALESARRGLRPLLLERDDFGQHTSGNWLRILHGGLRYLQALDIRRHVESVRERRWWLRHFPDLVEPLRCVMPLYGQGLRREPIMAAALAANDLLSWYRNRGVREDRGLPRGRTLSAEAVRALAPSIRTEGLTGGALWYDAVAPRPQRLLMELLRWGAAEGARVNNYVEVTRLTERAGRVTGVVARDRLTGGRELTFEAPVVVNCAGPWASDVAERLDRPVPHTFRPSLAFNVLFDRAPDFTGAWAVEARENGARTHFVHATQGRVLAGTCHGAVEPGASPAPPGPELIRTFARELDDAMPGLALQSARVLHVFWGLLPVRAEGTIDLSSRAVIHAHGAHGGPTGLFTVSGVKFTVARQVAARVLSVIGDGDHAEVGPPTSRARPDPVLWPDAASMHALIQRDPGEARALLVRLAESEAAWAADDVLLRRSGWGLDPDFREGLTQFAGDALGGRRQEDGEG